jgi:hypothetical protein
MNVQSNGDRNDLTSTVPMRYGWFSCLDAEKEVEIEAHEEVKRHIRFLGRDMHI